MSDAVVIVTGPDTAYVVTAAEQGPGGPKGDKGDTGDTGPGVAAGGTTGQVLAKTSNTDYATGWVGSPYGLQLISCADAATARATLGSAGTGVANTFAVGGQVIANTVTTHLSVPTLTNSRVAVALQRNTNGEDSGAVWLGAAGANRGWEVRTLDSGGNLQFAYQSPRGIDAGGLSVGANAPVAPSTAAFGLSPVLAGATDYVHASFGTTCFNGTDSTSGRFVQFGRRYTDSSAGCGTRVEVWPATGETLPVFATVDPGSGTINRNAPNCKYRIGMYAGGVLRWHDTSSTTNGQFQGEISSAWGVSTHASRTGRLVFSAYSVSTAQEGLRVEGNAGGVRLGFYGANAVAQPTGDVLTALANLGLVASPTLVPPVTEVAGTTFTLTTTDSGKTFVATSGSAVTCTLSATAAVGTTVTVVQDGAGQVTFVSSGSGTVTHYLSHTKTAAQKAIVGATVIRNTGGSAAEWVIGGATA